MSDSSDHSGADISLHELDRALAQIREGKDDPELAALDAALAEASGRAPRRLTADEAEVEVAVARAFGRDPEPGALEAATRARATQEAGSAAPWREACPWDKREALRGAEERLARLYSTRRGESLEAARRTATAALREAWDQPSGLGLTSDRFDAVLAALDAHTRRLAALPPISSTTTESVRGSRRMVDIVKEVRR